LNLHKTTLINSAAFRPLLIKSRYGTKHDGGLTYSVSILSAHFIYFLARSHRIYLYVTLPWHHVL